MTQYQEQVDRAWRFYGRFKKINDGMVHDRASDHYIDDIYAFFQQCYHVKDWLIHDPAFTKHSKAEIEDKISTTPALAICADICNGLKHLHLSGPPRSGDYPKFGPKHFAIELTSHIGFSPAAGQQTPVKVSLKWIIEHNGQKLDAFEIATDAMNEWDHFIK